MSDPKSTPADHEQLIEQLALNSGEPVEMVTRLYEQAVANLSADAQVMTYLPIFAARNVKSMLKTLNAAH